MTKEHQDDNKDNNETIKNDQADNDPIVKQEEETYEERERRLDIEEMRMKRNAIVFVVLPLFIGFMVFCYFFFQSLEKHKIASTPITNLANISQITPNFEDNKFGTEV